MAQQPVYVPPSFPTPLPAAPEPKRPSNRIKVVAGGACLAAFVTMGFVGKVVVRTLVAGRGERIETLDPYKLMSRAYAKNPDTFSIGVVKGAERGMRRNAPGSQITFEDKATVTDLGTALRAVANYQGEIPTADRGTVTVDGQARQYFHAKGAIVIETLCFTSSSMCIGREDLIARTDAAVMQHLAEDTMDNLLPPGGECQLLPAPTPVGTRGMTMCRVEGDMVMTLMRLSLADTRAQFKRFVDSGEARSIQNELDR